MNLQPNRSELLVYIVSDPDILVFFNISENRTNITSYQLQFNVHCNYICTWITLQNIFHNLLLLQEITDQHSS